MATDGFGFFSLPAELRNEIYRLTFEGTTTKILRSYSECGDHQDYINHIIGPGHVTFGFPGLLHASTQLRSESLLVFYSTTTFVACWPGALAVWVKFLESRARSALGAVYIRAIVDEQSYSGDGMHWSDRVDWCVANNLLLASIELQMHGLGRNDIDWSVVKSDVWSINGERLYTGNSLGTDADKLSEQARDPDFALSIR